MAKKLNAYTLKPENIEALKQAAIRLSAKRKRIVSASSLMDEIIEKVIRKLPKKA